MMEIDSLTTSLWMQVCGSCSLARCYPGVPFLPKAAQVAVYIACWSQSLQQYVEFSHFQFPCLLFLVINQEKLSLKPHGITPNPSEYCSVSRSTMSINIIIEVMSHHIHKFWGLEQTFSFLFFFFGGMRGI